MSSNSEEQPSVPERPVVFYRWRDERSPLIVELRLDLVPRIIADLKVAEGLGLEGGGVLIGSFPKTIGVPVLRIEDFESVGRRAGDGQPYVLLAEQRQRFTAVRKKVATREVSAIGFFRSHMRVGPFEMTMADRDLLSAEFKNTIHVALLIGRDQSSPSKTDETGQLATYFVIVGGVLQNRTDPLTFPFDEIKLEKRSRDQGRLLKDVPPMPGLAASPPEVNASARPEGTRGAAGAFVEETPVPPAPTGVRRAAWIGVGAIALLSALFMMWGWQRQGPGGLPGDQGFTVTVSKIAGLPNHRQALDIDWNRQSAAVVNSTRGHVTITNPGTHQAIQELDLQPNELTLGSLRVEMDEQPTAVTVLVYTSDGREVSAQGVS